MAKSLVSQIKDIVKVVRTDMDAVRDFANNKDIYVSMDMTREENRRVEKWLRDEFNIMHPEVNMFNFNSTYTKEDDYCWTLEYFLERQEIYFNCYFKMVVGKDNKVVVASYNEYHFNQIWHWVFGEYFDQTRMATLKTNNKGKFTATDEEVVKINEFNTKYFYSVKETA